METRVLTILPDAPDADLLAEAAAMIRRGGLVVFPTETVYALGANVYDTVAVDKVFVAKGRPTTDPLIVHIQARDDVSRVAAEVSPLATQLMDAFWPGPLTLVLPRLPVIADNVTAGLDTVALRLPNHPVIRGLIRAAGVPLVGPSANTFGHTSPTTAAHVLADLGGRVDAVIDSGATMIGVESTVLDVSGAVARLLRPGGVTLEQLRRFIPDLQFQPKYLSSDAAAPAPGMLGKHYAPRARLVVVQGVDAARRRARLLATAAEHQQAGRRVGLLLHGTPPQGFADVLLWGDDLTQVAAQLFHHLRLMDERGVDVIVAESVSADGIGLAIRDRLTRAAHGRVIDSDGEVC